MKLWSFRWSPAWGWHWKHERDVTPETAPKWLAAFKKEEPEIEFVITNKKPGKRAA